MSCKIKIVYSNIFIFTNFLIANELAMTFQSYIVVDFGHVPKTTQGIYICTVYTIL
jgi:hypothetical protein